TMADTYDVIIIGGGIGGGSLATVLARQGKSILVLEKSTVYRDKVRGEWIAPWGVVELKQLGLIDRVPRLAVINAAGADTLYQLYERRNLRWNDGAPDMSITCHYYDDLDARKAKADTIASAIEINRPVNLKKCLRALDFCDGVVRKVTDQEILDAKAQVGAGGIGCEPASAASVAGAKMLRDEGIIAPSERVVCILTGHQLKDPTATVAYHTTDQDKFNEVLGSRGVSRASFANRAIAVPNELDAIIRAIQLYG
ncbi:MAG: pyridoxal-phosphate dependent enzyme, partial [Aureliella sp.]